MAALLAATGCATSSPAAPPAAGIQLSATLVSPDDITLRWSGVEAGAASTVVEFATEPDGRYTILEFLPPDRNTFTHPDLMPATPFYYRVRPIRGPASEPITLHHPGSDLAARFEPPDGIRFTWPDKASDEEGYLLELKSPGGSDFRVAAVADRNATSFVLTTEPAERQASYRIRPFTYGPPSNIAHQTTGAG